jgi:hypothetical protein
MKLYEVSLDEMLVFRTFGARYGLSDVHIICETTAQLANEIVLQLMSLRLYHSTLQEIDWWKKYFPLNIDNRERYSKEYVRRVLEAFYFKFCGMLESGFRNLHSDMFPGKSVPDHFNTVYTNVLNDLGMADELKLLELVSTLRNLIHNNGVYTKPDKVLIWKERKISFVNGECPSQHCDIKFRIELYSDVAKMMDKVARKYSTRGK